MDEKITAEMKTSSFSRVSIFRPLWWVLQSIIIGIWEILVTFVVIWQAIHILFTGERHTASNEFIGKFINHIFVWTRYTFWVQDERPEIIEY